MFRKPASLCGIGAALLIAIAPAGAATLRAPGGGTVRALVIGIDRYANLPNANLEGAVADAGDIGQALAASGVNATLLRNGEAVRPRVVAEMNRLVADSKSGDLAIVSYAGHGMRVREYPQWKGIDPSGANTQIALSGYGKSGKTAHDIIVDKEMRAWLTRLDAKGVDVLLVMDSCYGGAMRDVAMLSGAIKIRALYADPDQAAHDSFAGIPMTQKEARADVKDMAHVTFLAGATANSVVPEMTGVDARNTAAPRGALSYFVARAIEGAASNGGDVTRETLFKSVTQNVSQATNARQRVDLEPRSDKPAVLRKIVFGFAGSAPTVASEPPPADPDRPTAQSDPVRVAVVNGASTSFSTIEKGNAPFVRADAKEGADLVWDVAGSAVVSRGDPIMSQVDGSLLGGVIDRTWAIQQTQRLSLRRALTVRLGDNDKRYTVNDHPALIVEDVRDRYLTVVNIAADGTLQILFPTHGRDPHMGTDQWTFPPVVGAPFGADHVIAVATSRPATELVDWLMTHNSQRDAAMLPAAIAKAVASDTAARIGTVGLYTTP